MKHQLELLWPEIEWREPVEVRLIDDATVHYACRFCIALDGLKGSAVADLTTDPDEVRKHIAAFHVSIGSGRRGN